MKHEISFLKSDLGELANKCDIAEEFSTYFGSCVASEESFLSLGTSTDKVFNEISVEDNCSSMSPQYPECNRSRRSFCTAA